MKIQCRKSTIQNYECQVCAKPPFKDKFICFDACLAKEIFYLWDMGIETVGSCCGKHTNSDSKTKSYIQVKEKNINKMKLLEYKEDKKYKYKPCNSFIPKTKL